ncbi:MAG: PRC-barrel domain-containing protein [Candidatus Thermoplasmatota archaeon]
MDAEVTSFYNLPVYTPQGRYLGVVEEVVLDLPNRRVGSILLARTSPKIVEGGHKVAVPFRWIAAIGDIIVLNHFPDRVAAQKRGRETEEPVAA